MLEFIVLGLIPGTNIQITFGWVLLLIVIIMLGYEFWHYVRPRVVGSSGPSSAVAESATIAEELAI